MKKGYCLSSPAVLMALNADEALLQEGGGVLCGHLHSLPGVLDRSLTQDPHE